MEQRLKSDNSGNTIHRTNANDYSVTDFDHEDIYDIIEYNDGLDGEFSDIDYHEIEDIFCDWKVGGIAAGAATDPGGNSKAYLRQKTKQIIITIPIATSLSR